MKDLGDRVGRRDPYASSEASVTNSSSGCTEAKKIASENCGQVSVGAVESVKENLPDVPGVPHVTQELQKPRTTPLRLPAEGKPCEYE